MKRAIIYARYSTDLQNDQSVEDQIRLCKGHAERIGAEVVGEYFDRARSGASMFGRPGLSSMMQAAERSEFDILISEAPDRISRDIADLAHIHKTLKFRSIEMNCVNGGTMDTVQIGMYGVIGQMQREEGAKKVKRGMVGIIRSGRNAGGKSFGYEPVPGEKGELQIVEAEAAVIRRIFDLYINGIGPRSIASALNSESIPAPRGNQWNASTINGNEKRGHGILRNPLYAGKRVWNRVRMVKDPSTGRRISRVNDASEIEYMDAPHLRIVSDEVYEAAQAVQASRGGKHSRNTPKSKRILSGLLRCGECGGGMSIIGADRSGPRIICSVQKESGTCSNKARYYVKKIENDVIERLRVTLSDTRLIDAYVREYEAESKRLAKERRNSRGSNEVALREVKDRIARIIDQVSRGTIDEEDVAAVLPGLKAERSRLQDELAQQAEASNVIEIKPKAVKKFRENIEALAEILSHKGEPTMEMAVHLRELVTRVIVQPRNPGEEYQCEVKIRFSAIAGRELSAVVVVAGGGIEPPTSGL